MKIIGNHHIKVGGKRREPGEEFEVKDADARILIKCGAAQKAEASKPPPPPKPAYTQVGLEKMPEGDLKKIADSFKVPGGKKEDVIKGILEAQKKGS